MNHTVPPWWVQAGEQCAVTSGLWPIQLVGECNLDPQPRDDVYTSTVWPKDWLLCLDYFFIC